MLDLSFNHIAKNHPEFMDCFIKFITRHKELLHLDVSHNGFVDSQMEQISKVIAQNSVLFGIHFDGVNHNYFVDYK